MSKTEKIIKEAETENEETKKVNSFNTILSIWNSMVGSSIVAIPYNTYYSGIIPAVLLNLIYGFLSFYTCKIYADCGRKVSDFSITVESHFNKAFGPKVAKIGKNTQIFFLYIYGNRWNVNIFFNNEPKFLSCYSPYIKQNGM